VTPEILRQHLALGKLPQAVPGTFVGATELPWPGGRQPGATVHFGDVGPVGLSFAAGTLTDLRETHELYHVGVVAGVVGHDPTAVYWAEAGLSARTDPPLVVELGCRLFSGELVAPPFDRTLYACPKSHWPGLARHLDRLAFVAGHGAAAEAWRASHWRGNILDPILARRLAVGRPAPPAPPMVPVHLFSLESEAAGYFWQAPADPWKEAVCLTFRKLDRPPTPPRR
jgi:hypothetical protein